MEKIANLAFYLLAFMTFISSLVVLVSKSARYYFLGAIAVFMSIGGIYLLLKSPLMFVIQIVFFALGFGLLVIFLGNDFNVEMKNPINKDIKTLIAPFILSIFILLIAPFLANQILSQKTNFDYLKNFFFEFASSLDLVLILLTIVLIIVLSGFYTIAFWRKK